jgi:hypothetical protein
MTYRQNQRGGSELNAAYTDQGDSADLGNRERSANAVSGDGDDRHDHLIARPRRMSEPAERCHVAEFYVLQNQPASGLNSVRD